MKIQVYGYQEDSVQVLTDGQQEEFHYDGNEENHGILSFSDGTVVKFGFDENQGIWRFQYLYQGTAARQLKPVGHPEIPVDYSEMLELEGDVKLLFFRMEDEFDADEPEEEDWLDKE